MVKNGKRTLGDAEGTLKGRWTLMNAKGRKEG